MSEHLCATCSRPIADGATICTGCSHRVEAGLKEITDYRGLGYDLDVAVAKQARMNAKEASRPGTPRLPYDVRASDAHTDLKSVLVGWVRLIVDETGADTLPADTLVEVAAWLRPWVGWLRHHPAAADAYTEITGAVTRARRATDRPAERLYAGPCTCGADLYAYLRDTYITCRDESHPEPVEWEVYERRVWLRTALEDVLATTTEIARALSVLGTPVTAAMIRGWRFRGLIVARGERTEHGRVLPLYRVGDALDILAKQAGTARAAWDNGGCPGGAVSTPHGTADREGIDMTEPTETAAALPDEVAAKVKPGHTFGADPTHALSSVNRWTCTVCDDAVLVYNEIVYGGATERTCEESRAYWGSTP